MFAAKVLRVALASTAFAGAFAATPAAAQVADPAPTRASIDANGVDLFLGTMNVDGPMLSAGGSGPGQGLAWRKFNHGGGWGDNLVATLTIVGSTAYVGFGATTAQFGISGSTYTSTEGDGATLSLASGIYTYTASDGTVAHFTSYKVGHYPYATVAAIVSDVTRPNGEQLTYTYDSAEYCSATREGLDGRICTAHATAYRIATVGSSAQYGLAFNYGNWSGFFLDDDVPSPGDFKDWGDATSVAMTNTAISGASVRTQSFAPSTSGGSTYYTITDPLNRDTQYRMTGASVAGIKLPGSASEDVTVTYGTGKVSSVTNAVGTWYYTYSDASGVRTVTVTNPASKVTTYTFDIASARMKSVTDATSRTTSWDYDSSGRVTRVTAPEGNYVQTTYDARGNVTETRGVDKTGVSSGSDLVTTASYDTTCSNVATCNQPNSTTDARNNTTDYTYGTDGTLLTVTAPAPTTGAVRPKTTYTYTTVNGVAMVSTTSVCRTTSSCANGSDETRTTVTYNANGLPATATTKAGDNSLSVTTTIGYDDVGNVTSVDGPMSGSGDTVTWRYDALRRRVGAIAPDPDGAGSLVRAAVRTTYDTRGLAYLTETGTVAGTSDSDWAAFSSSQQSTATLDAAGRPTRVVVTAGGTTYGVTDYSYDSVGRPDCVATRLNPSAWGTATAACTAQTAGSDGPDRIARATYDDAGRKLTTTTAYGTADASTEEVTYTGNGKVETATDAESNKTTYEYDGFDRLSKTTYPSTTKGAGTSNSSDYEQLTYDANGNVTNRRLRDNTNIGYTYDKLNRVTDKNLPGSELDVAYTYNLLGQPLTAATSAQTVTLGYDALGRNTSQAGPLGTVAYEYDAAGRRTRLTWPDTFYVTYEYDTAGNLKAIKESGTTSLAAFDYDSLGRRTTLTRGNGVVTSYGYDNLSRLTSLASDLTGTSYDLTIGLGYNNAGQIRSRTASNDAYSWTGAANVTRGYTANGLNQLTASGAVSLGYDARGNLTSSGSDGYTYSSENLLLTGPGGASLVYDPLLRLYQVSNTATAASRFVYDGGNLIATANTSGTFQRRYVTVPGSDEIIAEYKLNSSTMTWKILDERGSVVNAADASGAGTAPNTYDEYGIPGSNAMRYQYTGQIWLGEVGLYYYKARMYSPTLGRFMQTDPIGYGDGLNWYNYVKSDPVNGTDPSGLDVTSDPCKGEGVIVCWGGDPGPPLHNGLGLDNCNFGSGCRAYSAEQFYGNGLSTGGVLPQGPPDQEGAEVVVTACSDGWVVDGVCILSINYNLPQMILFLRDNPNWGPRPSGQGVCEIAMAACTANAEKVYDSGKIFQSNQFYRACSFAYGNCQNSMREYNSSSWNDPVFSLIRFPHTGTVYFWPYARPYFTPDTR